MKTFKSNPVLSFAVDAVRQAMKMARRVQAECPVKEMAKTDESPVTVADFAVQALIGKLLSENFPDDVLVAEEDAGVLRTSEGAPQLKHVTDFVKRLIPDADPGSVCDWIDHGNAEPRGRFWVLDPIDGTKGFLRGEQYAVALALIENGKILAAALGCPHLNMDGKPDKQSPGVVACAVLGEGAWLIPADGTGSEKRLQVSEVRSLDQARVLRSYEKRPGEITVTSKIVKEILKKGKPVLMDSQAKYVCVAGGTGDIFFYPPSRSNPSFRMKIWDVAPGALVIREAGGRITDFKGQELVFTSGYTLSESNPGLLISNGRIHDEALRVISLLK